MRWLIIVMCILLIGCKTETKVEDKVLDDFDANSVELAANLYPNETGMQERIKQERTVKSIEQEEDFYLVTIIPYDGAEYDLVYIYNEDGTVAPLLD